MGRKSTRANKTVYQVAREKRGLTIEKAGDLMDGITLDRISKIESGNVHIQPEDVVLMAECYRAPELCNYYCTHECAIGEANIDQQSLYSVVKDWCESLDPRVFEQVFSDGTEKALALMESVTNDEHTFILRLAVLAYEEMLCVPAS